MPVQFSVVEIFDLLEDHMAEQKVLELEFSREGREPGGSQREPVGGKPRLHCLHPLVPPKHPGGSQEQPRGLALGDGKPQPQTKPPCFPVLQILGVWASVSRLCERGALASRQGQRQGQGQCQPAGQGHCGGRGQETAPPMDSDVE